jgi:hypothetical protein
MQYGRIRPLDTNACPCKKALNAIQMQYSSEDDNQDESHVLHVGPRPAEPEGHIQPPPQGDDLIQISATAYTSSPSDSTISPLLAIQGQSVVALADTRSTNTFLDYKFAVKHNIPMVSASARTVIVAGGGTLSSTAIAPNCTFTI